jgi:hypothetical protein
MKRLCGFEDDMMKITTEKYLEAVERLPKQGQKILCHQRDDQIVVYQAYNHQISNYADITDFVKKQKIHVDNGELDKLFVPIETVYMVTDDNLHKRIGID